MQAHRVRGRPSLGRGDQVVETKDLGEWVDKVHIFTDGLMTRFAITQNGGGLLHEQEEGEASKYATTASDMRKSSKIEEGIVLEQKLYRLRSS